MTKHTTEKAKALVDAQVAEWLKNNPPARIKELVNKKLDNYTNELVAKILGMDTRWGGSWEVDHCNGRGSTVTNEIAARVKPAVDAWIETAFEKVKLPKDGSIEKGIQKEFMNVFTAQVRIKIREIAEAKATQILQSIVEKLDDAKLELLAEAASKPPETGFLLDEDER